MSRRDVVDHVHQLVQLLFHLLHGIGVAVHHDGDAGDLGILRHTDGSGITRTGLQGFMVYVIPNFDGMTLKQFFVVLTDAMGQLFYSISVAMGIMITYGSYLSKQEQRDLLETMESEDCTPSLSQAIQLKKLSQAGELNMDKIFDILREPKANQQDKISFRVDDLRKFFPKSYTAARIQETILKLLSDYQKKRQRSREER